MGAPGVNGPATASDGGSAEEGAHDCRPDDTLVAVERAVEEGADVLETVCLRYERKRVAHRGVPDLLQPERRDRPPEEPPTDGRRLVGHQVTQRPSGEHRLPVEAVRDGRALPDDAPAVWRPAQGQLPPCS
jgi:hypothetical protein